MKFKLTFKYGPIEVAKVIGVREHSTDRLSLKDVTDGVIEAEQFLEKLTGLRVHIEQA